MQKVMQLKSNDANANRHRRQKMLYSVLLETPYIRQGHLDALSQLTAADFEQGAAPLTDPYQETEVETEARELRQSDARHSFLKFAAAKFSWRKMPAARQPKANADEEGRARDDGGPEGGKANGGAEALEAVEDASPTRTGSDDPEQVRQALRAELGKRHPGRVQNGALCVSAEQFWEQLLQGRAGGGAIRLDEGQVRPGAAWRKGAKAVDRCFNAGLLPGDPRVSMQDSLLIKALLEERQSAPAPAANGPFDDQRVAKLAIAYQRQTEWNRSVEGALYRNMAAGFRQEDATFVDKLNKLRERLRQDANVGDEVERWMNEKVLWRGAPARFQEERLASTQIMRQDPENAGETLRVLVFLLLRYAAYSLACGNLPSKNRLAW